MIISGYQLMVKQFAKQRPTLQNIWEGVFPPNGPEQKSLIEISGCPGTGANLLLYQLMARAIIPTLYGGKESEVIFIDLAHKFDIRSFNKCFTNELDELFLVKPQMTPNNIVAKCLDNVIQLPCYSSDEFEFAFDVIDDLLWDHKRVSMLAIDGLDTFYWEDCYYKLQRMSSHYIKRIQRLKHLCQEQNICCAYTVDTNYLSTKDASYVQNSIIDYKLKLLENTDGSRFLNDKYIQVDECGIKFL